MSINLSGWVGYSTFLLLLEERKEEEEEGIKGP